VPMDAADISVGVPCSLRASSEVFSQGVPTSLLSKLKWLRSRASNRGSLMDAAREWNGLMQEGEALLGRDGWTLLRRYGRVMSGANSGHYVSALSTAEVRDLLSALQRGARVPVHLMHRHRSAYYAPSELSLSDGRLLMHYPDRAEPAEKAGHIDSPPTINRKSWRKCLDAQVLRVWLQHVA
jgi:hypothetical protein